MNHQYLEACKGTGKTVILPSKGLSMRPVIPNGSSLTVRFDPLDTIRAGDIIVFQREGTLIAHRVLYKKQDADGTFLIEKGDHQFQFGRVNKSAYLGKVSGINAASGETRMIQNKGRIISLLIGRLECLFYTLKCKLLGPNPIPGSEKLLRFTNSTKF